MKSRLHFFGQQPPLRRLAASTLGSLAILAPVAWGQTVQWDRPTYSSPIAVSRNDRLIWSVSPQDHTVAIIRPDSNQVIAKIIVGHQPESVALTPDGEYVYVANAADGTVTVLHVKRAASRQSHRAQIAFHEAMLYFYRKHYAAQTPVWLGWLVVFGIQLNLNWTRLRERLTRRAAPATA